MEDNKKNNLKMQEKFFKTALEINKVILCKKM